MSLGPYPDFAWSVSRHRTLRDCARKYFYDTYGMWGGWETDASTEVKLAYRLKKLEQLDMAVGTGIHRRAYELTTLAQEGRELPSVDALREKTRQELGELYRARQPEFVRDPKNAPMLHSFYYHEGPDEELLERVRRKLNHCLSRLRGLDLWDRIRDWEVDVAFASDPDQFVEPVVEVDGVPVYADPDLLLREKDSGRLGVLDWKTGRPRDRDERQVAVYGLFARQWLGADEVDGRLVYLLDGSTRKVEVTERVLDETAEWIRAGIAEMESLVADRELNRPRSKDAFPLTDDWWMCRRCSYFELCETELRAERPLPWERKRTGTSKGPVRI